MRQNIGDKKECLWQIKVLKNRQIDRAKERAVAGVQSRGETRALRVVICGSRGINEGSHEGGCRLRPASCPPHTGKFLFYVFCFLLGE